MKTILVVSVLTSVSVSWAAIPRKEWRPSVESVVEMLKMPPESRRSVLAEQPDSVYDSLLEIANAKERSMNLRWRALTSAAALRREKAVPDLLAASSSDQWFMRNAALLALAEFAPADSVNVAKRLVTDPALVVRSAAVDVLAKHGDSSDRAVLWSELKADYNKRGKQSLWIRPQIVKVLAENPAETELPRFSALLAENDESVQKAAIDGLERLTGMRLGEGIASHEKVVRLWTNYFSRPASEHR